MLPITCCIIILYLFLIGSFVYGFNKVDIFKITEPQNNTLFSIIIPFRNEADNLPGLLESILNLNYTKASFECIFVNDDSYDNSVKIIENHLQNSNINFKVIDNARVSNSPKKDAITTAVKQAKNPWIITTDADCILPTNWLSCFNSFIKTHNTACIVAPVTYKNVSGFLEQFQLLDFLSLQGTTMGSFGINKPFMCNGANFAYTKKLFNKLNGFNGNETIASGDDVFFLEKVAKNHPKKLHYLKSEHAIVYTKAQASFKSLIYQRLRWASKASAYKHWFGKLTGVIVLLTNSLLLVLAILFLLNITNFKLLLGFAILKFIIDFMLLYKAAHFFNQKYSLKYYGLAFLCYPFFSVFIVFISVFKTYKWKDRHFKK